MIIISINQICTFQQKKTCEFFQKNVFETFNDILYIKFIKKINFNI